ncbi:MAG: FAD-binding molybdopterin dehydrogenase [Aeromicrobium sp.]|nr:FAD-binding molybdopterin dehydrogenase [Aeromicrobium sp.]
MDLNEVTSHRAATTRGDLVVAPGEVLLAGGSWLFSEPQPGVTGLVDLPTMGWEAVNVSTDGLSLAATCTIAELLAAELPTDWSAAPLIRECAEAFLMSFKIWNTATVGGNICLALPAGAMISLATALDATAVIWSEDGSDRRQQVADFVTGVRTTTLAPGEVLRSIEFPANALRARTAFRKMALTPLGRSSAVVIGRLDLDGRVSLVISASTPRPVVFAFEQLPSDEAVEDALGTIEQWYDDAHGAPDWRAAVTADLARDVCAELRS